MAIKHCCPEWKGNVRIHPDISWLWGTYLEYVDREITDPKTQKVFKNFWILMDDTSGTYSIWIEDHCPFCHVKLETLN